MSGQLCCFGRSLRGLAAAVVFASCVAVAHASGPGVGLNANLEVSFLKLVIDHHYGALRMTELAAGTDMDRSSSLSPSEGTSPTPGFGPSPAKATIPEILSMARRANRVQREEILEAQTFLQDWYGITYQPQLTPDAQQMIQLLEQAQPGNDFNRLFLRVFSHHHYTILGPATQCLTGRDLSHQALHRYCEGIFTSQVGAIDEMRELLCDRYHVCDFQPFQAPDGSSSTDQSSGQ